MNADWGCLREQPEYFAATPPRGLSAAQEERWVVAYSGMLPLLLSVACLLVS